MGEAFYKQSFYGVQNVGLTDSTPQDGKQRSGPAFLLSLKREDVHRGHLLLVNASYPVVQELDELRSVLLIEGARTLGNADIELEETCMERLTALLQASESLQKVVLVSGYRTEEEQSAIYEQSMRENGPEYTAKYVALPGRSEHQTGLAIDVGELASRELDFIAPSFPDEGECGVIKKLAAAYGFIQRYKEGKEAITGIACEPWHFRYVGFPHSEWMEREGMCLEEYIRHVKRYSFEGERLRFEAEHVVYETYYAKAEAQGAVTIPIPSCHGYTVSGNNVDGFIVTAYRSKGHAALRES
ncbi:D-alanyl-D-alanine carboxypeptidase family protein [Paenibacillus sp. GCM10027627]|uniref:D-alanyl-D-alanine carboxypeptidase family protein n=1 Tax=unclassified Paenibacillus TaxID=185978 RepID=UPI003634993C